MQALGHRDLQNLCKHFVTDILGKCNHFVTEIFTKSNHFVTKIYSICVSIWSHRPSASVSTLWPRTSAFVHALRHRVLQHFCKHLVTEIFTICINTWSQRSSTCVSTWSPRSSAFVQAFGHGGLQHVCKAQLISTEQFMGNNHYISTNNNLHFNTCGHMKRAIFIQFIVYIASSALAEKRT